MESPPTHRATPEELFDNPPYCDMKIRHGKKAIDCSKWKLAETSRFFHTKFRTLWGHNTTADNEVTLSNEEPTDYIYHALRFCHTGHYPDTVKAPISHLTMYRLGQHFEIETLEEIACRRFQETFPAVDVSYEWFKTVRAVYEAPKAQANASIRTVVARSAHLKIDEVSTWGDEEWIRLCLRHDLVLKDFCAFKPHKDSSCPTQPNANTPCTTPMVSRNGILVVGPQEDVKENSYDSEDMITSLTSGPPLEP